MAWHRRLDAAELMRLHVSTLFRLNADGRLVRSNESGDKPAPKFFLGRTGADRLCWFRNDIDDRTAADLEALAADCSDDIDDEPDPDHAVPFVERLARVEPTTGIWAGPAFLVPPEVARVGKAVLITRENAELLSPYLEPWLPDVADDLPMAAALHDGVAVSVCASVRVSPAAHEAGVETHPGFTRRGFAAAAVATWAAAVRAADAMPLYSTSWSNTASRELVRKLNLVAFGADLHIT